MSTNPTICYAFLQGAVQVSTADKPCGPTNTTNPYVACCQSNDVCMSDNICYTTISVPGSDLSGYYAAGCTDPLFKDPSCNPHCHNNQLPHIVFSQQSSQWACCTESGFDTDCSQPTSETWSGTVPQQLIGYTTVATGTLSTSSVTSTGAPSSTPSSPSSGQSSHSGLGGGAIAGVAIGAIAAILGLLAVMFFFLKRRRDRLRTAGDNRNSVVSAGNFQAYEYSNDTAYRKVDSSYGGLEPDHAPAYSTTEQQDSQQQQRQQQQQVVHEMASTTPVAELPER